LVLVLLLLFFSKLQTNKLRVLKRGFETWRKEGMGIQHTRPEGRTRREMPRERVIDRYRTLDSSLAKARLRPTGVNGAIDNELSSTVGRGGHSQCIK
jgi:3-mercaptopyruvate sulfurtransferase SseA